LKLAARRGHLYICKWLLEDFKGESLKDAICDSFILKEAAGEGRTECCEYLITKGADVNQQSASGFTALMMAC
jgi:ankyrin repeat protein